MWPSGVLGNKKKSNGNKKIRVDITGNHLTMSRENKDASSFTIARFDVSAWYKNRRFEFEKKRKDFLTGNAERSQSWIEP